MIIQYVIHTSIFTNLSVKLSRQNSCTDFNKFGMEIVSILRKEIDLLFTTITDKQAGGTAGKSLYWIKSISCRNHKV